MQEFAGNSYTTANSGENMKKRREEAPLVTQEQEEQFIELRARGLSYDSIAKQLNISKPTLLKLGKEFELAISRLKYINYEALVEKHKLAKESRLESFAELLERVNSAIEQADLSRLSPDKLIDMKCKLTDRLKEELTGRYKIEASALDLVLEQDMSRGYDFTID